MGFRDDREALLQRVAALEKELAGAGGPAQREALEKLDALARAVAAGQERVEESGKVLQELAARIDELRGSFRGTGTVSRSGIRIVWVALGGLLAIGIVLAVVMTVTTGGSEKEPVVVERPADAPGPACPEAIARVPSTEPIVWASENPFGRLARTPGCFAGRAFAMPPDPPRLSAEVFAGAPLSTFWACAIQVAHQPSPGVPGNPERKADFAIRYEGRFRAEKSGVHLFRLSSDDGSRLTVDGRLLVDLDGRHSWTTAEGSTPLAAGEHELRLDYFQGPDHVGLELEVAPPGCAPSALVLAPRFACPSGAVLREDGPGIRCTYSDFPLPEEPVGHYCTYLRDGYMGFSWTAREGSREYHCPPGMERSDNGSGGEFCLVRGLFAPAGFELQPECDEVAEGRLGFRVVPTGR